jgi:uncharacterized membrane protein YgcG
MLLHLMGAACHGYRYQLACMSAEAAVHHSENFNQSKQKLECCRTVCCWIRLLTGCCTLLLLWCVLQADNVLLKLEMSGSSPAGTQARTWRPAGSSSSSGSGSGSGGVGSGGVGCEQVVAKVADLGLACLLEEQDTHISGVHRVSCCGGGDCRNGLFRCRIL